MKGAIYSIDAKTASEFLLPKHYSGRKPQISEAFGWYACECIPERNLLGEVVSVDLPDISHLKAVCTFGKPASASLCVGICGEGNSKYVYELNRLCRTEDWNEPLSQFVGACLRRMKSNNWIIVSYSDTGMHHNGYIYQACNFMYTGTTKGRTDKYTEGNKHSRHYDNVEQNGLRKVRTPKNRYVYFCARTNRQKKEWMSALKYPILPYPKNENQNYVLGEYQKQEIIHTQQSMNPTDFDSRD